MAATPNRLDEHWAEVKLRILQEWNLLSEEDLEETGRQFDHIVQLVRRRYGGRVEIIQEAAIRDALNRILQQLES